MMQTLFTLGRQPALGLAELESLYGADALQTFGNAAVLVDIDPKSVNFRRLGGATRVCRVLTKLASPYWSDARDYLLKTIPEHEQYVPEGKLTIGLSVIGVKTSTKDIERCLLEAKKRVKALGRSVRIVPNKTSELNAAQILHNNLTGSNGWELVVIGDGTHAYLVQTIAVQDIEGYAARDQARPYRDARVGMLPPKLAQTIINIAAGHLEPKGKTVLDPFCGTGVVLQEASLMGYDVFGTDLEPRMVEYSVGNLHWLREKFAVDGEYVRIEPGDATSHKWDHQLDAVASETYLGQPYATLPPLEQLQKNIRFVDKLHRDFLFNLQKQITKGTRLCLAVPAWRTSVGFKHLPVLDHLKELGYNEVKFIHATKDKLIYHRENQIVGRELVVLIRD